MGYTESNHFIFSFKSKNYNKFVSTNRTRSSYKPRTYPLNPLLYQPLFSIPKTFFPWSSKGKNERKNLL